MIHHHPRCLDIFGCDTLPLGVDGDDVGVLQSLEDVTFDSVLQEVQRTLLEPEIGLEILSNLPNKSIECGRCDQHTVNLFLTETDGSQGLGARLEAVLPAAGAFALGRALLGTGRTLLQSALTRLFGSPCSQLITRKGLGYIIHGDRLSSGMLSVGCCIAYNCFQHALDERPQFLVNETGDAFDTSFMGDGFQFGFSDALKVVPEDLPVAAARATLTESLTESL